MKINDVIVYIFIFVFSPVFSQDYELRVSPFVDGEIIFKDGSHLKGMVQLKNSAFSPRFKKDEETKQIKVNYKTIEKIITNPNSETERIFQYLPNNYTKFNIFCELIYSDVISIYIVPKGNGTDLFYSGFNRQSLGELFTKVRAENYASRILEPNEVVKLPNGITLQIPNRYSKHYKTYFELPKENALVFQKYISKEGSPKLMKVEKNKRFLKKSKEFFKECPKLIEDLENELLTLDDLPVFIEYYKGLCRRR